MSREMLQGKPLKSIIKFTLPILIGNLFQQFYSMVDTIIVGNTLSTEALAGVGATTALSFLVIGFVQGLTAGLTVITSQRFGAADDDGLKKSVAVSTVLCIAFSAVLTLIAVLCAKPLLQVMQTPNDIVGYSYDYIVTIFYGLAATMLYNITASLLRAFGDSRTPLVFLIIASLINIGLDLLFIMVFKMGVAGAGWATVLSQGLSGFACLIVMVKKFSVLRLKKVDFKTTGRNYLHHLAVSLPMAFQFSIIAVGIMVQQAALNTLGTTYVAAYTAANKIDQLAIQMLLSLGMGLAVYSGQNYGAGDFTRIKTGVNQTMLLAIGLSLVCAVIMIVPAKPFTALFIKDASDEILEASQLFLICQAAFYIVLSSIFVYRNALQGMGYSGLTIIACVFELGMRIFASLVFAKYFGFLGVSLSNPAAWFGASVLLVPSFYVIIRMRINGETFDVRRLLKCKSPFVPKPIPADIDDYQHFA